MKKRPKLPSKRFLIIASIMLLFAAAVFINIKSNSTEEASTGESGGTEIDAAAYDDSEGTAQVSVSSAQDYFTAFRESREAVRNTEIAYLDEIISDSRTDAETLAEAQAQKLTLVECMEIELVIENQLKAKGFADAAVTFRNGSVSIVIDAMELTREDVAKVLEVASRASGEDASGITVTTSRG